MIRPPLAARTGARGRPHGLRTSRRVRGGGAPNWSGPNGWYGRFDRCQRATGADVPPVLEAATGAPIRHRRMLREYTAARKGSPAAGVRPHAPRRLSPGAGRCSVRPARPALGDRIQRGLNVRAQGVLQRRAGLRSRCGRQRRPDHRSLARRGALQRQRLAALWVFTPACAPGRRPDTRCADRRRAQLGRKLQPDRVAPGAPAPYV